MDIIGVDIGHEWGLQKRCTVHQTVSFSPIKLKPIQRTTSVAVCILDSKHEMKIMSSRSHNAYKTDLPDGHAQQDVNILIKCTTELILEVAHESSDIGGISICGQMHGFMAWDGNLKPTTDLITWQDRRMTVDQCQQIDKSLQPGYGVATLDWFLKNEPDSLRNSVAVGTVMDYFVALLTSNPRIQMSPHNAQVCVSLKPKNIRHFILELWMYERGLYLVI